MRGSVLGCILGLLVPAGAAAEPVPVPTAPPPGRAVDPDVYRLVVDRFEGKIGPSVRTGVIQALEAEDSVDLVSIRLLDEQSEVIDGSADGYATAGKRLNVVAIVRGKIRKTDDGHRITLTVIRSRDGTAAGKLAYEAEKPDALRDRVKAELWRELEPILAAERTASASTPAAAAPTDDGDSTEAKDTQDAADETADAKEELEEKTDTPPPEPEPKARAGSCPWLEIDAQGGILTRNFNYIDEQRGALRGFQMRGAPVGRLDVAFYPWALSRCGSSSGLGLALGAESTVGAQAELGGRELTHFTLGTRGEFLFRIPVGSAWFTPRLGYAGRRFLVQGDFVTDVDVHALGGGVDVGVRLGRFVGELGGSLRVVLAAGQIQSRAWFPDATALHYDAGLRLGVAATPWLDVLLGGRLEYTAYQLNATGSGAFPNGIADSAKDAYLRGSLGLRFWIPSHAEPR